MSQQRVVIAVFALGGIFILRPQPAHASAWGCKVILCISNLGGPEQYAACVPPIRKLYDVLSHGGSFPTCSEDGTAAALAYEPPYFCPEGSMPAGGQEREIGSLAGCYYTDPKTEVTYLLAPAQNPYTMNVSIRWQGGSETVTIDPAADRSSLSPPQPPPVTFAQRLGQRIALEDVACGLSTEPPPAMRLYEAMWNNCYGTPTAAGFIENVPNAAISHVGELMLDQHLNDILAAHGIIERALARHIR